MIGDSTRQALLSVGILLILLCVCLLLFYLYILPTVCKSRESPALQGQGEGGHKRRYEMVLESVDAKPVKAFVVEEDHNHFKCPSCSKGFRKKSLLDAHVRHYHTIPDALTSGRRRRKTLSHCEFPTLHFSYSDIRSMSTYRVHWIVGTVVDPAVQKLI